MLRTIPLLLLAAACNGAVEYRLAMVTAYTPSIEGGGAGTGLTATGARTDDAPYGVAACPSMVPFGAVVKVPGYRETEEKGGPWWPVDDTGGALRQAARRGILHLDLRMRNVWAARNWGVRWLMVAIYTEQ